LARAVRRRDARSVARRNAACRHAAKR
jgi:hypothetical protein